MELFLFLRVFGSIESIQIAASLGDENHVSDLFSFSENDILRLIECTVKIDKYIDHESLRGLVFPCKVLKEELQEVMLVVETCVYQFALENRR